jgi:hypothetical protein
MIANDFDHDADAVVLIQDNYMLICCLPPTAKAKEEISITITVGCRAVVPRLRKQTLASSPKEARETSPVDSGMAPT